ncbi:MAG: hypothetical protein CMJ81_17285 [Planctomycetaceae bacterium]|nr:hypothetical protein [Planctomycetaceae bacterium]MBP62182.1 hypothetical protein [Planctomycetaceae bacterium]
MVFPEALVPDRYASDTILSPTLATDCRTDARCRAILDFCKTATKYIVPSDVLADVICRLRGRLLVLPIGLSRSERQPFV